MHKLESRLPVEISIISAMQMTLMAESEEELKSFLMKVKEESEKVDSKLNIQKTKIVGSLIGIALNLQIALGSIVIFTILILTIHEHGIFLHIFVFSLISFVSVL